MAQRFDLLGNGLSHRRVTLRCHDLIEQGCNGPHVIFHQSTGGDGRCAKPQPTGHHRRSRIIGNAILVGDDACGLQPLFGIRPSEIRIAWLQVNEQEVVVRATSAQAIAECV